MKLYCIWNNLDNEYFSSTESKRVANTYLSDLKYDVWCIEGRKGNQIIARFNHWTSFMLTGGPRPIYATEVKQKPIKRKRTEEHNAKISRSLRGKSKSEMHCSAISEAMLGNTNRSK